MPTLGLHLAVPGLGPVQIPSVQILGLQAHLVLIPLVSALTRLGLVHLEVMHLATHLAALRLVRATPLALQARLASRQPPLLSDKVIFLFNLTLSLSLTAATNTNPDAPVAPVTTGSLNPTYVAYTDKDQSGSITHFQAISAAPAYRGTSFEVSVRYLVLYSFNVAF